MRAARRLKEMPIYETKRPAGEIGFIIPYPGEELPVRGWKGLVAWLRQVPTPEETARQVRATDTVFCWLIFIFFVWLCTYDWPMTLAILHSPYLWWGLFFEALALLLCK
jgi:hypothetical protein